jgi:hypothetical protein
MMVQRSLGQRAYQDFQIISDPFDQVAQDRPGAVLAMSSA